MRDALARRGDDTADAIDSVLDLDQRWREATAALEDLRAEQNRLNRGRTAAPTMKEHGQMTALATRGRMLSDSEDGLRKELDHLLLGLPNIPAPDAPDTDTVLREVGEAGRTGRDHLALAGAMIDMERAAVLSGTRFAYLRGDLVLLELALVRFVLERLIAEGFEPVIPPVLVREQALYGTGMLPDTEQQIYRLADDELYLTGTSEVALASLHRDEVLNSERLPLRYAGVSSCFRREAGAAGKDTRGIFRVHQFDKVEMFSFVAPDESRAEHERLLTIEETILKELEIPYRVVAIAVNDLGASAAKKYDCEAWLPGQRQYREVTSCSNTTEYQARRLNIRYRGADRRPAPVHTLNGTAVTWRHMIALLENGQQEDGTVTLPEVLTRFGAPSTLRAATDAS